MDLTHVKARCGWDASAQHVPRMCEALVLSPERKQCRTLLGAKETSAVKTQGHRTAPLFTRAHARKNQELVLSDTHTVLSVSVTLTLSSVHVDRLAMCKG